MVKTEKKKKTRLRAVFNATTGITCLYGLAGVAAYLAIPTLARISGTWGAVVGTGSGLVLAIATGQPAIAVGTLTAVSMHASYVYLNPKLYAASGLAFFGWSEDGYTLQKTTSPATTPPAQTGVSDMVTLPNGKRVQVHNGLHNGELSARMIAGNGTTARLGDMPRATPDKSVAVGSYSTSSNLRQALRRAA